MIHPEKIAQILANNTNNDLSFKEWIEIVESLVDTSPLWNWSNLQILEEYADIPEDVLIDEEDRTYFAGPFAGWFADRYGLWAEIDLSDALIRSNVIYNVKVHLNTTLSYVEKVGIIGSSADKYFSDNETLDLAHNEIQFENEGRFLSSTIVFTLHGLDRLTNYYLRPYTILPDGTTNTYKIESTFTKPPTYVIGNPPFVGIDRITSVNKRGEQSTAFNQSAVVQTPYRIQGDQITFTTSRTNQTAAKNISSLSAMFNYQISIS